MNHSEYFVKAGYNRNWLSDMIQLGRFSLKFLKILEYQVGKYLFNLGMTKLSKRVHGKYESYDELLGRLVEKEINI